MKNRGIALGLFFWLLATWSIQHKSVSAETAMKDDPINILMKITNIDEQIALLPDLMREIINNRVSEQKKSATQNDIAKVERIFLKAFQPLEIRKMYYDCIKSDMPKSEIKTVIDWYDSPLGRKIAKQSIQSLNPDELKKRGEFETDIMNLQAPPHRLALIQRYMKSADTVKKYMELEYKLAALKVEIQAKFSSAPLQPLLDKVSKEFETNRNKIEKTTAHKCFIDNLFGFRNLSDDDLEDIADFIETREGQTFNKITNKVEQRVMLDFLRNIEKAIYDNISETRETWTLDEYNFKYTAPDAHWVKIDAASVNPNAKLCLFRSNPQMFFFIIPEVIGVDSALNMDYFVEFSKAQIKSVSSECRISDGEEFILKDLKGFRYDAAATVGTYPFVYRFLNILKNGAAYQLIVMSPGQSNAQIVSESERLFSGFQILNTDKILYSNDYKPLDSFSSPFFNYSLDLKGQGWAEWNNLRKNNPEAEVGGEKERTAFIVVPAHIGKEKVASEVILSALLNTMDIVSSDKNITNLKEFRDTSFNGFTMNYHRIVNKTPCVYAIRIIIGLENAYMIAVWTDEKKTDINALADKLYMSLSIHDTASTDFDPASMTEPYKKAQASFDFFLGSYYYKAKHYDTALTWHKKATLLDTSIETYLISSLSCYSALGELEKGMAFLDEHAQHHPGSLTLLSWKAWLLKQLSQNEKSLDAYRTLFSKEYRNDSDFIEYVDLLGKMKRWDDINPAFAIYIKKDSSLDVHIKQASLLHDQRKYRESVNLLQRLQKDMPFQPDISFALARNYNALEEYKDVIAVAEALITRNIYLTDAYFLKGEAEFNLKWYHKAKDSFEHALQQSPEDNQIKNYIQHISGMIGQGDNTQIKKAIKPVPIPAEIAEQSLAHSNNLNSVDYGAYYITFIQGIHFQKEGDQRLTTYRKIKLLDKSGVSAFSTIEIDFDPLSENLYVNSLEVKDENGKVISKGDCSDYYIMDNRSSDMATHDKVLNIPIPNLKPGYTIELTSTKLFHSKDFVYYWGILSKSRPILYSVIFVTGDTKLLCYKTSNIPGMTPLKTGLAWTMTNPPIYEWEPLQGKVDDVLPMVRIACSGKTWQRLGEEYLHDIAPKLVLDEKTKKLARSLTERAKTKADKIKSIVSHIQSDYTYKAIEFGKRAIIPNTSQDTIEKKYGDCKDHALLLHQMLKAVSIPSFLVLVNSGATIDDSLPSLDQFNHMINYIPDADKGYFIDTTSKHLDMLNYVPMGLANQKSLILEEGNIHLKTIPPYNQEAFNLTVNTNVNVSGTKDLKISETVVFKGYSAAIMRDYLSTLDKVSYTNWLQKLYSDKIPKSTSFDMTVENINSLSNDLSFNIAYDVKDLCERTENRLSFTLPDVWMGYYLEVPPVPERKTDFQLSYPMALSKRVTLNIPDGFSLDSVQSSDLKKNEVFGTWYARIAKQVPSSTLDFFYSCPDGQFDKITYPAFKAFSDQVIEAASPEIVMKRQ